MGSGGGFNTAPSARSIGAIPQRLAPRAPYPVLLASVADLHEAEAAIRGGADVLDLKDPRRGALGAAPLSLLREVIRLRDRIAPGLPVSAALGAARDPRAARLAAEAAALGCDFLKTSLERLPQDAVAVRALERVSRAVVRVRYRAMTGRRARAGTGAGSGTRLIAAGFADAACALCPDTLRLPAIAAAAGFDGCLLDTAVKDGRSLFDHLPREAVAAFVRACRERDLLCALAGSLGPADLASAAWCSADLIGARGALCDGGRSGRLVEARVRRFRRALRLAAGRLRASRQGDRPRGTDRGATPRPRPE
jgi:uncharacterized protein (UPF0264 family)